jgi:diguanylate cyclase
MDRKQEDMIRAQMMAEQAVARMNQRLRWPMSEDTRRSLVESITRSGSPEQYLFSPEPYRPTPPRWSIGGLMARIWLILRELRGDPATQPKARAATLATLYYAVQRSGAPGMFKIFLITLLLTMPPIGLAGPFEILPQMARDALNRKPATEDILVVAKDDPRTSRMGVWTRKQDAILVDRLRELGVERMVFNEIMSLPTRPDEDAALASAFERARGKVWLGAMQADPRRDIDPHEIVPIKQFRSRVQLSSSSLMWGPFNEIMWFDGTRMIDGKPYPSQISVLADRPDYTKNFVPDYSIEFRTIRTIAAIDIFNGSVTPDQLAGKAVFISYIEPLNTKLTRIPGQGAATAAYANVMAAQSIKSGLPVRLGMAIPFIMAIAFGVACILAMQRRKRALIIAGSFVSIFIVAAILDRFGLRVQILPAYLALTALGFREALRSKAIDAMLTNPITGLPNLAHLEGIKGRETNAIVAVKVERYQDFIANRPYADQKVLLNAIVARINVVAPGCIIYQGEDGLFLFLVPPTSDIDVSQLPELLLALFTQDVVGLHSFYRVGISVGTNNDVATNFDVRLALAIERATVSAYITPYAVQ